MTSNTFVPLFRSPCMVCLCEVQVHHGTQLCLPAPRASCRLPEARGSVSSSPPPAGMAATMPRRRVRLRAKTAEPDLGPLDRNSAAGVTATGMELRGCAQKRTVAASAKAKSRACKRMSAARVARRKGILHTKARNAWTIFRAERKASHTGPDADLSLTRSAVQWKTMTEEQRRPYVEQAAAERLLQLQELSSKGIPFRKTRYVKSVEAGQFSASAMTPASGHVLGEYEVSQQARACTGSYGMVVPGYHACTGAKAAIKLYNFASKSEAAAEVDICRRLQRNISGTSSDLRRHFPTLLLSGADQPLPFIVLSWRGICVQRLLPLAEEGAAVAVITQTWQALRLLRVHGVVHTDIKPDNILFRADDRRVTIIDFQYAEVVGADGRCQPRHRTYSAGPYRPPELWAATTKAQLQTALTLAVGVWAYGVVTMRILSGKSLFSASCESELRHAICVEWQLSSTRRRVLHTALQVRPGLVASLQRRDPNFEEHLAACLLMVPSARPT